jgi:streptogramin lyase
MFRGPGLQANGLEAVPEGLWICDQRDNHCYLVDYDGQLQQSFPTPARNSSGITFGSGSVWVASNTRPAIIFRHDVQSGRCTAYLVLAGEGGVHGLQWRPYAPDEQIPAAPADKPEPYPSAPGGKLNLGPGVSGTLWVSRPTARTVEHLDAETGDLLGTIDFPLPRSHGMFWDERDATLSVSETNTGHIFRFDPRTAELLDEWRIEGPEVHGLALDSHRRVWIGDASTNQVLMVTLP